MQVVSKDALLIPDNRIRREFDPKDLEELAHSIADKGLLHPPVLREDRRTLVAGERRIRAMSLLHGSGRRFEYEGTEVPNNHFPYTTVGDLTSYRLREAELEENVIRRDLSWQERARAVAELHSLRGAQRAVRGEDLTMRDFASELLGELAEGERATAVANTIRVAEYLGDPEVSGAENERAALKVIAKKAELEHRARLAERFDLSKTPHTIWLGDSLEKLKEIGPNSVDIILTDPPYGIEAGEFGSQAGAIHKYVDSPDYAILCNATLAAETERICRANAFIFVFCDLSMFEELERTWRRYGFSVFSAPLIWNKVGVGMLPWPNRGPRRTYECILFALRGERILTKSIPNDVISVPGLQKPRFGAEKPKELYSELLSWVARPGDVVLDPFAGAGPILPAANSNSCIAIAIEQDKEKFNLLTLRLEEGA